MGLVLLARVTDVPLIPSFFAIDDRGDRPKLIHHVGPAIFVEKRAIETQTFSARWISWSRCMSRSFVAIRRSGISSSTSFSRSSQRRSPRHFAFIPHRNQRRSDDVWGCDHGAWGADGPGRHGLGVICRSARWTVGCAMLACTVGNSV